MNPKAYVAEFIATFALIFVGVGSIAVDWLTGGGVGLVGIALAHGLTIPCMASATMATSGHINPAVTIAALITRKIDSLNAVCYVVAQCLGAIAGAAMLAAGIPAAALDGVRMGTPAPGEFTVMVRDKATVFEVTALAAVITEVVLTFLLVFVISGTAVDRRAPQVGALFIGLTVAFDVLAGGPISGAAMNPARHLGPALLGGGLGETWMYWVGPLVGAGLAAVTYALCVAKDPWDWTGQGAEQVADHPAPRA